MGVRVTLDKAAVKARVEAASKKATSIIANELLKDSNYFCREDSGELKRSAIRASKPEDGKLIWDTPYAKRMYYIGHAVTDKNQNASLMWAQKAADTHHKKYLLMAKKVIKEEV